MGFVGKGGGVRETEGGREVCGVKVCVWWLVTWVEFGDDRGGVDEIAVLAGGDTKDTKASVRLNSITTCLSEMRHSCTIRGVCARLGDGREEHESVVWVSKCASRDFGLDFRGCVRYLEVVVVVVAVAEVLVRVLEH